MSELAGFILYCTFIYVVDCIEYNICEFILTITGNLEE